MNLRMADHRMAPGEFLAVEARDAAHTFFAPARGVIAFALQGRREFYVVGMGALAAVLGVAALTPEWQSIGAESRQPSAVAMTTGAKSAERQKDSPAPPAVRPPDAATIAATVSGLQATQKPRIRFRILRHTRTETASEKGHANSQLLLSNRDFDLFQGRLRELQRRNHYSGFKIQTIEVQLAPEPAATPTPQSTEASTPSAMPILGLLQSVQQTQGAPISLEARPSEPGESPQRKLLSDWTNEEIARMTINTVEVEAMIGTDYLRPRGFR